MKKSTKGVILFLLGVLALRLVLYVFNYPDINTVDPSLEYLVVSHIVNYHEFPLVGTTAFEGTVPINSPLYYYLLAFILTFGKSIFSLNTFSICLQSFIAIIAWITLRPLFGTTTAIITVLFLSLSSWGMRSSRFFFQPYLMQPFFFASIASLYYAWISRKLSFVLISIIAFVAAISFYLSAIAYLPVYLLALLFALKRIHHPHARFYIAMRTFVISASIAFASVVAALLTLHTFSWSDAGRLTVTSANTYSHSLSTFSNLFQVLLFPHEKTLFDFPLPRLLTILFVAAGVLIFIYTKSKKEKYYLIGLVVLSLIPIFVTPLFAVPPSEHYLHLAVGFGILYTGFVTSKILRLARSPIFRTGVIIGIGGILFVQSGAFKYRVPSLYPIAQQATDAIEQELTTLTREGNGVTPTYGFSLFKVQQVGGKRQYSLLDGYLFWHLLEERMGKKLVATNIARGIPLLPKDPEYLFVVCHALAIQDQKEALNTCIPTVMDYVPYVHVRRIFATPPFTMHLFKRDETPGQLVALGKQYFLMQQFSDAVGAYSNALARDPSNVHAYTELGNALIKLNRLDEAKETFIHARNLDPTDDEAYTGLGRVDYTKGNYAASESYFKTAISLNPKQSGAYFDLGKLYRILRKHRESETAFSEAIANNPNSADMMYGLGYLYMQYREFDQAEAILQKGITIDPSFAGLYSALGDVYLRERRYDESEAMFTKALTLDPNTDLFTGLSELYIATKRYDQAEATIKKGIDLNPKADRYQGLGSLYLLLRRYNEAETAFKKAIEINPEGNGYIGLGNVYQNTMRPDLAEEAFKRCFATPFKAQAWLALGGLYMNTNRLEDAESMLKLATTDDEIKPRAYISLGDLYLTQGKKDRAKEAYTIFKTLDPNNPEADERLAQLQ